MKAWLCLVIGLVGTAAGEITRGEIGGAKFMISTPEKWQGKLAVKVAGYRSDVAPGEGALYLTPNGWVAVVINGGNAAKAIGVTTGDAVVLANEGAQ